MRAIRTSGSIGRGLETGSRRRLNGHEAGNGGYGQAEAYGALRQPSTLQLGRPVRRVAGPRRPPPVPPTKAWTSKPRCLAVAAVRLVAESGRRPAHADGETWLQRTLTADGADYAALLTR
jgi:hypothetical protein